MSQNEKKKEYAKKQKNEFISKIKHENNNMWIPKYDEKMHAVNTNSWFNIHKSNNREPDNDFIPKNITFDRDDKELFKAKRVILKLTDFQKILINNWLKSYTNMYNEALRYIKKLIIEFR